ncbi:MAG TPA: ATP-binding cassette domain-containing protein [Chloroflexota bacterium]|nr:ATP-binding cassette domain-containing protein [Chloroflexota bacterium]
MSDTPLLGIDDLCLRRGARDVLCGVTAHVRRGELVALMGLSGAGKSTVLRAVAALEPFDRGTIVVGDARLTAGPLPPAAALRPLRAQVGMVFQHHSLFEHLSAVHNVWLAPVHVHRRPQKEAEQRALQLLEELGVGHRARALPREISGGEAQRVAIARALAMDPPLLLMDEPTASLDPARRDDLGQTLRTLTASGRTLLLTTHDDDFVRDYADRIAVLADGLVVEEGDPREILAHPSHPATLRLLQKAREE